MHEKEVEEFVNKIEKGVDMLITHNVTLYKKTSYNFIVAASAEMYNMLWEFRKKYPIMNIGRHLYLQYKSGLRVYIKKQNFRKISGASVFKGLDVANIKFENIEPVPYKTVKIPQDLYTWDKLKLHISEVDFWGKNTSKK